MLLKEYNNRKLTVFSLYKKSLNNENLCGYIFISTDNHFIPFILHFGILQQFKKENTKTLFYGSKQIVFIVRQISITDNNLFLFDVPVLYKSFSNKKQGKGEYKLNVIRIDRPITFCIVLFFVSFLMEQRWKDNMSFLRIR